MNGNLLGGAAQAWRLATDLVRDHRRRRRAVNEINALGAHEASRVLGEAGLTPAEFGAVMERPFASADLLSQGMASVGIDVDEFSTRNPAWFRELQRSCMMCRLRGRCRQTMLRGEFARRHREFCPNSRDFEQILSAAPDDISWRDPEAPFQPHPVPTEAGH